MTLLPDEWLERVVVKLLRLMTKALWV